MCDVLQTATFPLQQACVMYIHVYTGDKSYNMTLCSLEL